MNTKNTEEGEEEENCYMKFGNERDLLHFRTRRTGEPLEPAEPTEPMEPLLFVHKNSKEMKLKLKIPEHCSRFRFRV